MDPWLIVAGGGTAGHIVPGIVVAQELVRRGVDPKAIHFVGSERGIERTLVPDAGFDVTLLSGRGIQRRLTKENLASAWGLVTAFVHAFRLLRRHRPAVVLTLGGYASVPCGVAAMLLRIPMVVAEQNARAGLANRVVGRAAKACAVPFAETDLPHAVVTGNPVRPEILNAAELATDKDARDDAAASIKLPTDRTAIVVFTGSLGSFKVNTAVSQLADRWAQRDDIAIHHVVGRRDYQDLAAPMVLTQRSVDDDLSVWGGAESIHYQRVPYEDRMGIALAAADAAVCRAGGTTVAELAVVGVPAVLVPLPIATRNHQEFNAGDLVRAGGATLIVDAELTVDSLEVALAPLVDSADVRARMSAAARSVGHPDAASRVANLVQEHARPS